MYILGALKGVAGIFHMTPDCRLQRKSQSFVGISTLETVLSMVVDESIDASNVTNHTQPPPVLPSKLISLVFLKLLFQSLNISVLLLLFLY